MGAYFTEQIPRTASEARARELARLLPPPPSRKGAADGPIVVGRAPTWAERVDWGVIAWAVALYAAFLLGGFLS